MRRTAQTILRIGLLAAFVLALWGCGGESHVTLRIYDSAGGAASVVGTEDVVRSSARASRGPGGSATLFLALTDDGAIKLESLTRTLARRGAKVHRPQTFTFEIDGKVYARPKIDYRAFPDGLDGSSGLEIGGLPLTVARQLAGQIREG